MNLTRMYSVAVALGFSVSVSAAGCGSDGGDSGTDGADGADGVVVPGAEAVSQTHLSTAELDAARGANSAFDGVLDTLESDGFTTAMGAGRTESSEGKVITWAEVENTSGDARAAIGVCNADGSGECSAFIGRVASGKAVFTDAAGDTVPAPALVAPVFSKDLDGPDHDGPTEITGPLTIETDPGIDLGKRTLTIASAYGDIHGVDLSTIEAAAKASGGFTDVVVRPYARAEVLDEVFGRGSPADALIWIGAAVREPMGDARKTIGMTVNRGLYGDATYKASTVETFLEAHPFGGPGLVVLLGEDTRGDGSGQDDAKLSLFAELSDTAGHRTVVAVRGRAAPAEILAAGDRFAESFFGGADLAAALDAGTAAFTGDATLVTDRNTPKDIVFLRELDGFWGGTAPTGGTSTHILVLSAVCVDDGGAGTTEEANLNVFSEVTFDGPFFSGSRQFENGGASLSLTVSGVLLGKQPGDGLFVKFGGDLAADVSGLTLYGTGAVSDKKDAEKPNRVYYDGTASTSTYQNAAGDTCTVKTPNLSGKTNDQASWLEPKF
ncbi:MAG: hypothetical protein IV100_24970 [Myxococcales bacterium]|nr:hypothetical protein [Myxococcales bacterium]